MQVILAPKSGGLLFCSHSECHEVPFPWTASHVACSGVTGAAIAVVTKRSSSQESWLHILDGGVQSADSPCALLAGLHGLSKRSGLAAGVAGCAGLPVDGSASERISSSQCK